MQKTEPTLDPSAAVVEACHAPWAEAWLQLDQRVASSVIEPLRQGLARHQESVASIGLDADPPESWTERSDRLLEYRRTVGSALLEPLAEGFESPGPAAHIAQTFTEAMERAAAAAQELPVEVTAQWPEGALAPRPSDGFRRRVGKVLARGVSAARKGGESRSLPLRGVALHHLAGKVSPGQDGQVAGAMAAWAEWSGRLERAFNEWADDTLPVLIYAELPDNEEAPELWATVRAAAATFEDSLRSLAEEVPHQAARTAAEAQLDQSRGALEADLAVAGSFLFPDGQVPAPALPHTSKVTRAFTQWDGGIASRMKLYASLLGILAGATEVQRRVVQRFREGSLSRTGDLLGVASALRALTPTIAGGEARGSLKERIAALDARIMPTLQPIFGAIPEPSQMAAAMDEVADAGVEALLAVIRQAPATLSLHNEDEEPPTGAKRVDTRALPLQELTRQSFDALRIERIRASTQGLLGAVGGVRSDLEGLPEVFSFARDEALRELDSGEPGSEARAVELLTGAVDQMATALETRVQDLEKAIRGAQVRLATEICDGSSALLGRVGAGRMHAQLLAARSRAADLVAWVTDTWGPPIRRAIDVVRGWWKRAWEWIAALVRKGSALLGREPTAKVASARAIQSLAEVQRLVEGLPLVYQRLFTLDPISDPALLAGREAQLDAAMQRWQLWHSEEGVPLVVRGRQRSGITSFLNVLGGQLRAEGHAYLGVTLSERLSDEGELAKTLAEKLELPACRSLDELARAIFDADERSLPAAISVDNLEHLYMRVPKGTDLTERFLTLMAETEPRIFWIGGVTASAWQLIATAEPTAVSQVDVMDLPPLDAAAVRTAILARHRRSGLDVHYEESVTRGARLRRRIRRLRDKKGFKKVLEDEFFDQLHRASGGYLGLALFLWLQSAKFDPDEGVVMSLPSRPDFSVLDQLSLTQNFSLKAFLEHRTLTLAEHDQIFRLPRHESYQVLESLRNRQLIQEVARASESETEKSEIDVDLRYRVRPLLTGAVIAHLQGRNIVH